MKRLILLAMTLIVLAGFNSVAMGAEAPGGPSVSPAVREGMNRMIRAGVPEGEAIRLTLRMEENRFGEADILRVQDMVAQCAASGLPAEPLISKALEGMAKKVESRLIIAAMETVRARLAFGRSEAARLSRDGAQVRRLSDDIVAGMAAGIREEDVRRIGERLRTRDQARDPGLCEAAYESARDLARMGVSSRIAADAVEAGLQGGYTGAQMRAMTGSFEAQAVGRPPEELGRQFTRDIKSGVDPSRLGTVPRGTGSGPGLGGPGPGGSGPSGAGPGGGGQGRGGSGPGGGGRGGGRGGR